MSMDGGTRRENILAALKQADKAISASKLAESLGVSRQIIVGDIALLRAAGEAIVATARGYRLQALLDEAGHVSKLAVQHRPEQTEEELRIFVACGVEVVDVIVEHEIYGEITGNLQIQTDQDVTDFINKTNHAEARLLSDLTNGVHLHTLRYTDPAALEKAKQQLAEKDMLYQN
ncbi:transcription repressor NadR [Enterococcus casseliflavus]|uniref:transcription repressor NadR n=1 Tax=Enterococcus casseliflavus TaxID=37734 RepID=UPI0039A531FF